MAIVKGVVVEFVAEDNAGFNILNTQKVGLITAADSGLIFVYQFTINYPFSENRTPDHRTQYHSPHQQNNIRSHQSDLLYVSQMPLSNVV